MIKTQDLEYLIKLSVLSPYIKGERPVSMLVAARVESGKTEILKKAMLCNRVLALNDVTAYGIQKAYLKRICEGEIKTIIIPDLIVPLSKQPETVETFISFINGLIEEGVSEVRTFAMMVKLPHPARCNLITSIAKEHLDDRRHRWSKIGFLSRVIPVSYEYASSTVFDIVQSIALREYQEEKVFDLEIPDREFVIDLPVDIALKIASLAPQIIDAQKLYGFRLQKQLQTLCMANALFNGRDTCTAEDFERIKYLADYINLRYRPI